VKWSPPRAPPSTDGWDYGPAVASPYRRGLSLPTRQCVTEGRRKGVGFARRLATPLLASRQTWPRCYPHSCGGVFLLPRDLRARWHSPRPLLRISEVVPTSQSPHPGLGLRGPARRWSPARAGNVRKLSARSSSLRPALPIRSAERVSCRALGGSAFAIRIVK
jgi:hypothetical protein